MPYFWGFLVSFDFLKSGMRQCVLGFHLTLGCLSVLGWSHLSWSRLVFLNSRAFPHRQFSVICAEKAPKRAVPPAAISCTQHTLCPARAVAAESWLPSWNRPFESCLFKAERQTRVSHLPSTAFKGTKRGCWRARCSRRAEGRLRGSWEWVTLRLALQVFGLC